MAWFVKKLFVSNILSQVYTFHIPKPNLLYNAVQRWK